MVGVEDTEPQRPTSGSGRELGVRKRCLLATNDGLRELVAEKLKDDWSPEQISGWLKREYPNHEAMRVSHETIYRTLFVQARGALERELLPICAPSG